MNHNREMEFAVVGAPLVSSAVLEPLLTEVRLRPEHFHHEWPRAVFRAMCALHDDGRGVDSLTVAERLKGTGFDASAADVDALAGGAFEMGNVRSYAERLVELASWRYDRRVAEKLIEAAELEDRGLRDNAMAALMRPDVLGADLASSPDGLRQLVWDHVASDADPEVWPWPKLPKLNDLTLGGRRPGGVTVIGGWTGMGKSVWLDQVLQADGESGLPSWLFINEMTRHERVMRLISRLTQIELGRLMRNKLTDGEKAMVADALPRIAFGMTDAAGWSAMDIARDARGRGVRSIGVDIMHNIDHQDESDLRRITNSFKTLALQANAHVMVTVHLNTRRLDKGIQPAPRRGDIRGSGMIANLADNVMFVHRRQDDRTGWATPSGWVYFDKVRTGQVGSVKSYFDGARVEFLQAADAHLDTEGPGDY